MLLCSPGCDRVIVFSRMLPLCYVLQDVTVCCCVLHNVTLCCCVLQDVTLCCCVLQDVTRATVDMPVLLKLQRKVKELEEEKRSLFGQLNRREEAEQEKSKVGWTTARVHVNYCLMRVIGIRLMLDAHLTWRDVFLYFGSRRWRIRRRSTELNWTQRLSR